MTTLEANPPVAKRLTADQIHALVGELGLAPTKDSPLVGLPRPTAAVPAEELAALGVLDEPWSGAMHVLCAPTRCVRTLQAWPDRVAVAVHYRAADSGEGLSVGYWPVGDRMQLTAPCRMTDLAAHATGALATHLVRDIRDPLVLDLSVPGLAALAAAVDVLRADLFESMLRRNGRCTDRFPVDRLHRACADGRRDLDARWMSSLLNLLMPVSIPLPDQLAEEALDEVTSLGLIELDNESWQPTQTLRRLASYWKTPLPAMAHEVIAPDRYRYLIALRGDGPLFTLHFWKTAEGRPGVTLASIRERDYQRALEGLLRPFHGAPAPAPDAPSPAVMPKPAPPEGGPEPSDTTPDGPRAEGARIVQFPVVPLGMILLLYSISRSIFIPDEEKRFIWTFICAVVVAVLAGLYTRIRKIPLPRRRLHCLAPFFGAALVAGIVSDFTLFFIHYEPGLFEYVGGFLFPGLVEAAIIAGLVCLIASRGRSPA